MRSAPAGGLRVFAVEPHAVQACWTDLGPGEHVVEVGGIAHRVRERGAGAVASHGLRAGARHEVRLDGVVVASATTLVPPAGRELVRVATVSDLHAGERAFGYLPRIRDAGHRDPYPVRCARAAIAEAVEWGARLVVVKGDIAHEARRAEYDAIGPVLAACPVPLVAIPGNHDGGNHRRDDPSACLGAYGVRVVEGVERIDLDGLSVVVANTRWPRHGMGRARPVLTDLRTSLAAAPAPCLLAIHHQVQRTIVPTHWPPGIVGLDAHRLLGAVAESNPATLVTSGHTHRHRRRSHGPLAITEVGSTKDHPGTWAGYIAYEHGVVQTVRRIASPEAITWTEDTARMLAGQWARWSAGALSDRCFSHTWPVRATTG